MRRACASVLGLSAAVLVVGLIAMVGAASSKAPPTLGVFQSTVTNFNTHKSSTAKIVGAAGGFAVYTLTGDSKHHPKCLRRRCRMTWPWVTIRHGKTPIRNTAIKAKLGVWKHNGVSQLTLGGHPLYFFFMDKRKKQAKGEAIVSFGGTWHVWKISGSLPASSSPTSPPTPTPTPPSSPPPRHTSGLHVVGSHLEDSSGTVVRLHGVDIAGGEYSCIGGNGVPFDGSASATQTNINNLLANHINAVRLPMNEDCWLGINGVPAADAGANYQTAFENWVNLLLANGIYPILDLHWSAPGTTLASGQNNMADEDHSVTFWSQVATAFKGDPNVIFDLYNEPHGISWSCWLNGGTCSGVSFPVAGMQQLVNTIRAAGAGNVLMLGCDDWANGCDSASGVPGGSWVQDKPTDPDNNLAASVHIYSTSGCRTPTCFTSAYAPIIQAGYPVIVGEFGDLPDPNGSTATQTFATNLLNWMDQNGGAGYTAWTWNNWGNSQALIASSNGSSLTAWGTYISGQYAQRFG